MLKFIFFLLLLTPNIHGDEIDDKIEQIMKPCVLISDINNSFGSGIVIYSEDQNNNGEYSTFVLTNHHVIFTYLEQNIDIYVTSFKFDGLAGQEIVSAATVIDYNEEEDIAVLKLEETTCYNTVTFLNFTKKPRVTSKVYAVGATHGLIPLLTSGYYMGARNNFNNYDVTTAQIGFGSSGGGLFIKNNNQYKYIGITTAIAVDPTGPVHYITYSISNSRILAFIQEKQLFFLIDNSITIEECMELRGKK